MSAPQEKPLLTVEQVAERLAVPPGWIYKRAPSCPFTRKLGHRTLRFDPDGFQAWLDRLGPHRRQAP